MPSIRAIASSTFIPSTSRATPCVFPEHPPTNSTERMISPSSYSFIIREQTPFVLYSIKLSSYEYDINSVSHIITNGI